MKTSLTIGMPHLSYNGLDVIWLSKTVGDAHWNMLKGINSTNKDNQRLYASFFYGEIEFLESQNFYKENDTFTIDSSVFKYNHQIYRSKHQFINGSATFDSIFVKKSDTGLVRDDPVEAPTFEQTDTVSLLNHKALKKQLANVDISSFSPLVFNPEIYFNGVGILYCANYLNLVYLSEFNEYKKVLNPIQKMTVYYFGNVTEEDKIYGKSYIEGNKYITMLATDTKIICYCDIRRVG